MAKIYGGDPITKDVNQSPKKRGEPVNHPLFYVEKTQHAKSNSKRIHLMFFSAEKTSLN